MFILTIKDLRRYIASFQKGKVISEYNDMIKASRHAYKNILEYHHKNSSGNWMYFYRTLSDLHLVGNVDGGWMIHAMDIAAAEGHFKIVVWLHENGKYCSRYAMDWAAKNGYFHIIKYLHKNRFEGCTKNAIKYASENEHFDIVKFLKRNGYDNGKRYYNTRSNY